MDCEVDANALNSLVILAASIAQGNIAKTGETPLRAVLLRADDNGFTVSALNSIRSVELVLAPADVGIVKQGAVLIDAQRLSMLLTNNRGKKLSIKSPRETQVVLRCAGNTFNLSTELAGDFPKLNFGNKTTARLSGPLLVEMLKRTTYAAHTQQSRMLFEGVCFLVENGMLYTAATNGALMAVCAAAAPADVTCQAVVNAQHIGGVSHLFDSKTALDLDVEISANALQLSGVGGRMRISRIVGTYPPFRSVIPQSFNEDVILDRKHMLGLIRQLDALTFVGMPRLKFEFSKGQLALSARGRDGEFSTTIYANWNGSAQTIYYNPDFVSRVLTAMTSETVRFRIVDELHPSVIKEEREDINVVAVFSPLRPGHE